MTLHPCGVHAAGLSVQDLPLLLPLAQDSALPTLRALVTERTVTSALPHTPV